MKNLFIILLFALSTIACDKDRDQCPTNISCTMEYRMITVDVKDTLGNPVELDYYEVYVQGSLIPMNLTGDPSWQAGTYVIIADDKMNTLDRYEPKTLRFDGYLDTELVVREYYVVTHDCCHVVLQSGTTEVVI
jgi:hypothetical protein